jgi:hypothetical protein
MVELQSKPTQRGQGGKIVEFLQPRKVATEKASPGSLAPSKVGNEGAGQEVPWNVEEQVLLPLLLEEKNLLANYGPGHPDVRSVRERIQIVREYLAQHPPAPPPTILRPQPPMSPPTPFREVPSAAASTTSWSAPTRPLPFPAVRSQILEPGGQDDSSEAKERFGNTQTITRSWPKPSRPAGFSAVTSPILQPGPAAVSSPVSPPTTAETRDKGAHPSAVVSDSPPVQVVASAPGAVGDSSAGQSSREQPRSNTFFETGFGQLLGILGAVFLGVLVHLIALVFILRRYGVHLARVFRVELVNPSAVGFVGQVSTAAQPVATGPAIEDVPPSSTAETFDLGPTYAEEMRQKQEALHQQEEAVLRSIFELNMQMRAQLGQLSGSSA